MRQITFIAMILAAVFTLQITPAAAQQNRTFVSGSGNDSSTTCSRTAPCRSFSQAISVTNAGGEIIAIDSAGYGPFTIAKAISVTAQGIEAAISVTSGDGITINAGTTDVVDLRALTLTGAGGDNGITFNSGGTLNIQNSTIRGFTRNGVNVVPMTGAARINISDTIASNNQNSGFFFLPNGGAVTALLERVQAIGNNYGVHLSSSGPLMTALVGDSLVTNNTNAGLYNDGNSSVVVVNLTASGNAQGLVNGSSVAIINSRISGTGPGFYNQGTINSFGNNTFTTAGGSTGSLTPIAQQ